MNQRVRQTQGRIAQLPCKKRNLCDAALFATAEKGEKRNVQPDLPKCRASDERLL